MSEVHTSVDFGVEAGDIGTRLSPSLDRSQSGSPRIALKFTVVSSAIEQAGIRTRFLGDVMNAGELRRYLAKHGWVFETHKGGSDM